MTWLYLEDEEIGNICPMVSRELIGLDSVLFQVEAIENS